MTLLADREQELADMEAAASRQDRHPAVDERALLRFVHGLRRRALFDLDPEFLRMKVAIDPMSRQVWG